MAHRLCHNTVKGLTIICSLLLPLLLILDGYDLIVLVVEDILVKRGIICDSSARHLCLGLGVFCMSKVEICDGIDIQCWCSWTCNLFSTFAVVR